MGRKPRRRELEKVTDGIADVRPEEPLDPLPAAVARAEVLRRIRIQNGEKSKEEEGGLDRPEPVPLMQFFSKGRGHWFHPF